MKRARPDRAGDRRRGAGAPYLLLDARRRPRAAASARRRARGCCRRSIARPSSASRSAGAGARRSRCVHAAVADRARARARLADRAPRTRRPPTTPRSRICWRRSISRRATAPPTCRRRRPGSQPAGRRGRPRDAGGRARAAARARRRDGAGRLRARRRATDRSASSAARVLELADREPAAFRDRRLFPLDADGGHVDRLARRGRRAAS